jgi:hypothetical protein
MNDLWLTWKREDVLTEVRQAEDEGLDLTPVRDEIAALTAQNAESSPDFKDRFDRLLDRIRKLPLRSGFTYTEPSDLEGIRRERPDGPRRFELTENDAVLSDRIHGAWLGRCAGCLLGKPVEGARTPEIHQLVRSSGHDFLTDYIWRLGPGEDACRTAGRPALLDYWPGINHMPSDDDINYTILGMCLIREKGLEFTPSDIAQFWMLKMPLLAACTAERRAYRNFADQIDPPESAFYRNPYREWIGAQIRADFFGYAALGRPELAAELAWRDGSISHIKNGIYGEMWTAAMLASAPAVHDPRRLIETGLSEVPQNSRFTEGIRDVLSWYDAGTDYPSACRRIHERWDEYDMHHWCHTISNAQITAMALLWGEGDFEQAVTRSVWPGFDTDCNGATVGSIMGMILGARALPEKWTSVMNDTVHSLIAGYQVSSISGTAGEMYQLYKKYRTV